ERGLSPYQGLLHAIWTDERITTCCISMRNTEQIRSNVAAAQSFEPLKRVEIEQLRDASLAAGPTLCADCDGRCARAAGTAAARRARAGRRFCVLSTFRLSLPSTPIIVFDGAEPAARMRPRRPTAATFTATPRRRRPDGPPRSGRGKNQGQGIDQWARTSTSA